ncbi:hypothetical protein B0H14DRAFT_3903614 [Mycena olivaceomarginata]|nr:hypothetical protein B0H14DRAFT_3903614 [Mycena olivaceomarginata]
MHLFFLKPGSSLRWSSQSSMRTRRTSMVSLSATSLDPLNPESLSTSTSTSTSTSPLSSCVSFTNVAAAAGGVLSIKSSAIRRQGPTHTDMVKRLAIEFWSDRLVAGYTSSSVVLYLQRADSLLTGLVDKAPSEPEKIQLGHFLGIPLTAFWLLDEEDLVQKGKAASSSTSPSRSFSMLSAAPNPPTTTLLGGGW